MDLLALDNLNTLTNIDEDTLFMFDDKTIIINDDDSNYKIRSSASLASLTLLELNFEYGFYFTFHQSFTILENNINRNVFITDLNNALNNLYNNKQFTNIIDSNDNIKEMMEEISSKLDILTEKFMNKNFCHVIMDELYSRIIVISKSIVSPDFRSNIDSEESDDDSSGDDFVKDDDMKEE